MVPIRNISEQEQMLIKHLITKSERVFKNWEEKLKVKPLLDGGMGSLLLIPLVANTQNRVFGKCISEFIYSDDDDVTIIASLYIDNYGQLYELDMWKTDFTKLISYPSENDYNDDIKRYKSLKSR